MIATLVGSLLAVLVAAEAPSSGATGFALALQAVPAAAPTPTPALPTTTTPTDDFGPDLKAWLDANKLQDKDAANKALASLQRRRAERGLTVVNDVAGALSGRAEVRAVEGAKAEAVELLDIAIGFAPDAAGYRVRKAGLEGSIAGAWEGLGQSLANPFEEWGVKSTLLLGVLVTGALFAAGFGFSLLLRYGAVFSHDVAEGLPGPLKSLTLFMAVLFVALPLGVLMGWGYLPFWWMALFYVFGSRAEKIVSVVLLSGLALSSLALPFLNAQRAVDSAVDARHLFLAVVGGTSAESEGLVKAGTAANPADLEWSLLSANLSRRAGRFDEAGTEFLARASVDTRFAHNAAALDLHKGDFPVALPRLTEATEAGLKAKDTATAFYNLSLAQANSLDFDLSKVARKKGDNLDAALLARYDRIFAFDRDGSILHGAPDIAPDVGKILSGAIPQPALSLEIWNTRLGAIAIVLLVFVPAVTKFRGVRSFSKQCPKCGTTFCWLCQTRSTSQDVCSQCHHLFVVKRGIPPNARALKNAEIASYGTRKRLWHRLSSLLAPGSGHLSVGHFGFGLPVLLVWAIALGGVITVQFLSPLVIGGSLLGSALKTGFSTAAVLTYIAAQAVKPKAPFVAPAPRRTTEAEA